MVVVDDENRVIGVISLSDILTYIVLKCDNRSKPPPYQSIDAALSTSTKTASLTQAFGLTRLSTSHDHVILNEGTHAADLTVNQQPLMSNNDHGTIFEDDPMETEQQQQQPQQPLKSA